METKELKFKTNLNCGACVAKVKTDLDNNKEIINWDVDLNDVDRTLSVTIKDNIEDEIISIIENKGFRIEKDS